MSHRVIDQGVRQGRIAQSIIGSPWAHAIMNSILGNQNPSCAVCTRPENGRECVTRRSNSVAGSNRLKHFPHSARSEWASRELNTCPRFTWAHKIPAREPVVHRIETMTRVLVVEDQRSLLHNLERGLLEEGYEVVSAASIDEAREALAQQPDLILLDLLLPDGSGIDLLRQIRAQRGRQPILILTARDSVDDRIQGLDAGADDYLVKPFSFSELLARLRALLRRRSFDQQALLSVEGLEVDRLRRVAFRDGRPLEISNRQFELLAYLMQNAHRVVSREMIARDVWKESTATWTNVIEVHIAQLRRKIERPDLPTILHTVRGQGYQLGNSP
jgi:DNA-binding response OmpR family regulator